MESVGVRVPPRVPDYGPVGGTVRPGPAGSHPSGGTGDSSGEGTLRAGVGDCHTRSRAGTQKCTSFVFFSDKVFYVTEILNSKILLNN